MNVLIADDDAMTRSLLRRVLVKEFAATVTEAADGLQALSAAGTHPPDLIITDLRMPVMDGIALLEALRQFSPLAATPVVMMTAARESEFVQRAIALGVSDYLLKPLQVMQVNGRLRGVVERITRQRNGADRDTVADLDERTPVLVADGNGDFRHFVATALGSQRVVHQASSGLSALQRCGDVRPGIVIVGGDLGVLGPELLMRKLRAIPDVPAPRLFHVVPKQVFDQGAASPAADGVLARTFVSDHFRAAFDKLIAQLKLKLKRTPSGLAAPLATIAEQVLGTMLHREVLVSAEVKARPAPQVIVAETGLSARDGATDLTLTLRTDRVSATSLAASQTGADISGIDDNGIRSAAAEVVTACAAGIARALDEAGAPVGVGPVRHEALDAGDLAAPVPGGAQLAVHTADGGLRFVLQLASRAPARAGAEVVGAAGAES